MKHKWKKLNHLSAGDYKYREQIIDYHRPAYHIATWIRDFDHYICTMSHEGKVYFLKARYKKEIKQKIDQIYGDAVKKKYSVSIHAEISIEDIVLSDVEVFDQEDLAEQAVRKFIKDLSDKEIKTNRICIYNQEMEDWHII